MAGNWRWLRQGCRAAWPPGKGGNLLQGPMCPGSVPPGPWGNDTDRDAKDAGASQPAQHRNLRNVTTSSFRQRRPFPSAFPFAASPATDPRGTAKPRQPQDPRAKPSLPSCQGSAAAPGSSQAWLPPRLAALHTVSVSRAARRALVKLMAC